MITFLVIKTIILLGLAGYQIIITIFALRTRLVGYLSYPARPRCTRVYDVEGGIIFSKNSTFVFFDGAAPLWLLSGGWTRSAKHDGAIDRFELSCNEPSYCADLEEQKKINDKSWK